jgi:toluene monooxygenase electron transfer component
MKIELSGTGTNITFQSPDNERILYAGLKSSPELPYECATGTCGSCKAKCIEGSFEWAWSEAPARKNLKNADELLMCQCIATSNLKLEVKSKLVKSALPFSSATWMDGKIKSFKNLAPGVMSLSIKLQHEICFLPGQFMVIEFSDVQGGRAWSMTNFVSGVTDCVDFVIKMKPGGELSNFLFDSNGLDQLLDQSVRVFGPIGKAVFDENISRDLVCIAGGTGIASMMSILEAFSKKKNSTNSASLFFGVRTQEDVFFMDELTRLVRDSAGSIRVVIAFSDKAGSADYIDAHEFIDFDQGFVHEVAMRQMDSWKTPQIRAYLAGPPPLVDGALRALLLQAKLPAGEILYDKFG